MKTSVAITLIICGTVLICALNTGCSNSLDNNNKTPRKELDKNSNVAEIWYSTAKNHELKNENIVFVGHLLGELNADSMILSKEDQSRLYDSLDLYLKQFGFHFKAKAKPEIAQMHGYWLAWLISNGIKRTAQNHKNEDDVQSSYEQFFEEFRLDINARMLKKNGADNYAKYSEQIHACTKWLKDILNAYYSDLHDDFLFPAFKCPLNEEIKEYCLKYAREASEVPTVSKPKDMSMSEEKCFITKTINYSREISKLLAYAITVKTIWKDFHKTPEWGYMDSESRSCDLEMGKWPIDVMFRPDHDFNRAKALEEENRKKEEEEKKVKNESLTQYSVTLIPTRSFFCNTILLCAPIIHSWIWRCPSIWIREANKSFLRQ
ncbi:MAG: hypothetical protein ACYSUC_05400 [Planctomycetota bacterium]|jgi:hypothetical protein